MENIKEEATEYLSLRVTPSVKKEFDFARDNEKLKEEIIRRYITSEVEIGKDELKKLDDISLLYRAKLIYLEENFDKSKDKYNEEIEKIYEKISIKFSVAMLPITKAETKLDEVKRSVLSIMELMNKINLYNVERFIDVIEKFNGMTELDKKMLGLLLNQ